MFFKGATLAMFGEWVVSMMFRAGLLFGSTFDFKIVAINSALKMRMQMSLGLFDCQERVLPDSLIDEMLILELLERQIKDICGT